MGEVEIVESGSLDGLTNGWEQYGARTRIMMLGARADRHALRNHGRTVAIEESAVSVFHRPRAEREDIDAIGLDHALASFQFVDVAMADLGRWMQPLIGQGWVRGEVQIVPSSDASFEGENWACFHHPAIPLPEKIPLSESPSSMSRKAFVTHPGPILDTVSDSSMEDLAASMISEISQTRDEEIPETEPAPVVKAVVQAEPEPIAEPIPMTEEDLPPVAAPQTESPLESEMRQVISLLVAGGQEMGDIMEHPQFIEVSERAAAAGVDVWGMFVRLSEES
ncbi:MAG: hypothetical protein P8Q90_02600 [Candidatus Thalassarchaeaceae archaeon]|nr:hypothetical protein [Candidatus Thalassarchaeaceae archaeon]